MEETTDVATINTAGNLDKKIQADADRLVAAANSAVVNNEDDRAEAAKNLKSLKDKKKDIKEYFEPMRKAAHDAKQAILDKINAGINPIDTAIPILEKKMIGYDQEQARIAREKAETLRKIEQQNAWEADEAERKRLETEKEDAIEHNDDQALDRAEYDEKVLTPQSAYTPPSVAPAHKKTKGYVAKWRARVTNFPALLKAANENPQLYGGYVVADEKALNVFAKVAKDSGMTVPGVVFEDMGTIRS